MPNNNKICNKKLLVHPCWRLLLIANSLFLWIITIIILVLHRVPVLVSALSTKHIKRIDVCQNKDCSRRFASNVQSVPLPQVIRDLLGREREHDDAFVPEICTTGCLSQCDKGPNIQIVTTSGEETFVHGIQDHVQAAAELQALGLEVHPKLLAAVTVLERVHKSKLLLCSCGHYYILFAQFVLVSKRLHFIESPMEPIMRNGLYGAICSQYEESRELPRCCRAIPNGRGRSGSTTSSKLERDALSFF